MCIEYRMSGKYVMYYPVSKVEVNLECMWDFVYILRMESDIVFTQLIWFRRVEKVNKQRKKKLKKVNDVVGHDVVGYLCNRSSNQYGFGKHSKTNLSDFKWMGLCWHI